GRKAGIGRTLMPVNRLDKVLRCLRRMAGAAETAPPDRRLLDRFVDGDQTAFAALVKRHGGMVLGVCQRVLDDVDDAEDAFQATFLVLSQKARAIRRRESVSSWLYGVAYRTALNARTRAARRRAHERRAVTGDTAAPANGLDQDLRLVLDAELARLPEKYRAPLVLCYLEGKTNAE